MTNHLTRQGRIISSLFLRYFDPLDISLLLAGFLSLFFLFSVGFNWTLFVELFDLETLLERQSAPR